MILHIHGGQWYIDVRSTETSDQLSQDLTHHLPRRLAAGRVVVLTDNTKVFLSVIRKRWMRLLYEVECQRSSTLDRERKAALQYEVNQMKSCRFASKPPTETANGQVYFLTPAQMPRDFPDYMTLYITVPLSSPELDTTTASLTAGGLVVVYGWQPHYDALLKPAQS